MEVCCDPIQGTEDPREGMKGPEWDFLFQDGSCAGGAASSEGRLVYLHPSAKGDTKRATYAPEADRWAAWMTVRE